MSAKQQSRLNEKKSMFCPFFGVLFKVLGTGDL